MGHTSASRDLHIVQLTDCHLYGDPSAELLGVNTLESFHRVLRAALPEGAPPPDAVIATGDLVHDCSAAGYRHLGEALSGRAEKIAVLPGNHDDPAMMKKTLPDYGLQVCGDLVLGNWRLVMLDSHVRDMAGGRLSAEELRRLDRIAAESSENLLLFVHHHPLPIGSSWLDRIALANGEELLARVRREPRIRGVVWGHVHQSWEERLGQARLLGTPSTCIQFVAEREEFALATEPPAWREFTLHPNGSFTSRVCHLQETPMGLATESNGY